jgi:hypothetical protein
MAPKQRKADVVARQRRLEREAAEAAALANEWTCLVQEIERRVPELLVELEAQDYPEVRELEVLDRGLIRGKRTRTVGAWLMTAGTSKNGSEAWSSEPIYMLSDGRFSAGSTIISPRHIASHDRLRAIAAGLRALDQRLDARRPPRKRTPPPPPPHGARRPLPPPSRPLPPPTPR